MGDYLVAKEIHSVKLIIAIIQPAKLEAVKQELSHKIPDGKLEDVLRECFRAARH